MAHNRGVTLLIVIGCLVGLLDLATPALAQQPVTPKIIEGTQVQPAYPDSARRLGIQGTTTLRVFVLADGHVAEVASFSRPGIRTSIRRRRTPCDAGASNRHAVAETRSR